MVEQKSTLAVPKSVENDASWIMLYPSTSYREQ